MKCFVPNCPNYADGSKEDITFHRVPTEQKDEWFKAIGRHHVHKLLSNHRICSKHFATEDFYFIGDKKNLKKDAIPSLKIPLKEYVQYDFTKPLTMRKLPVSLSSDSEGPIGTPKKRRKDLRTFHNYCSRMGVPLPEVIEKLQNLAPLKLAESWDNVGLLVEPSGNSIIETALLTIDLTEDIVDEAIENEAGLIISYHPNIFKPLKRITQSHWKQRIITKCIRSDIAVFSPHTSWDVVENGVNDWLASAFTFKLSKPIVENSDDLSGKSGVGRILTLAEPVTLKKIVIQVKKHIGIPHLRVGIAKHEDMETIISTIAICAGSGGTVLGGIQADLYLTGEMLHHDVLEATQNGINVILCNHSDSERGYLKHFQEKIQSDELKVIVSKVDKDCLVTV